jgi:hypothetical protein
MLKYSQKKTVVLTIATSSTISAACDLGIPCEYLSILLPILDSTTIMLQVSFDGTTYKQLGINGSPTVSTTGDCFTTLALGGYQYIKIVCGSAQSSAPATRTFEVRGYRG